MSWISDTINLLAHGSSNWQRLGGAVGTIGTVNKLPEYGISEKLASIGSQPSSSSTPNYKQYSSPIGPQPAPSGSNTGGGNTNTGQVLGTTDNNSGYSEPTFSRPSDEQINAVYDPIFSNLSAQEAQNQQFYNTEKGYLEENKANQLSRLGEQEIQANQTLDSQKLELNQQIQSALNQAMAAYNALKQRGNVFYGGASGTGDAMAGLAGREFLRQQGSIEQSRNSELGKIQQAVRQTETYFNDAEKEIELQHKTAFTDLFKSWQDAQNQIRNMRDITESQRRQYKLDVDANVKQLENQILSSRQQQQEQLSAWKQMRDYELSQEFTALSSNMYQTPEGVFKDAQSKLSFNMTPQTNDRTALLRAKAAQYKDEDDIWFA